MVCSVSSYPRMIERNPIRQRKAYRIEISFVAHEALCWFYRCASYSFVLLLLKICGICIGCFFWLMSAVWTSGIDGVNYTFGILLVVCDCHLAMTAMRFGSKNFPVGYIVCFGKKDNIHDVLEA